jgi:predicted dehydrogenase
MPFQEPIHLAIIGAGVFARDAHLPAIQALRPTFEVQAVYSRRLTSAVSLASQTSSEVDTYTDLPALLARDDIEAVDILLPIDIMPSVVEQALRAGKHVISEKPIAPDVATARQLLLTSSPRQVWMVAENFRYEEAFIRAGSIVMKGELGKPLLFNWVEHRDIGPGNKYYETEWRRTNRFPGGFVLDWGVHFVAALRLILGEIASVTATTAQMREDLPPVDTLSATLRLESGLIGTLGVTWCH